jgi:hypothetical protein
MAFVANSTLSFNEEYGMHMHFIMRFLKPNEFATFYCNGVQQLIPILNEDVFEFEADLSIFNINTKEFKVYNYGVMGDNGTRFEGSFPVVPPSHKGDLKIAVVSCNDNAANGSVQCRKPDGTLYLNDYHDSGGNTLWYKLKDEVAHVTLHLGDNIYADSAWDHYVKGDITIKEAVEFVEGLYVSQYSNEAQAACMRQGLHIQMVDDHDYANGMGGYLNSNTNEKVLPYVTAIDEVHKKMHVLPGNATLRIGKYCLVCCDTRRAAIYEQSRFPESILDHVSKAFTLSGQTDGTEYFICLPQPLVHLDVVHSQMMAWLLADGKDESSHPSNRSGALALQEYLFDRIEEGYSVKVVAGDIHFGMIQTYTRNGVELTEMCTSPITRISQSDEPFWKRMSMWIQKNIHFLRWTSYVTDRSNYTTKNNYGLIHDGKFGIVNN